jgi:glycosyltransferase involved in cell wall biosynthesis
MKILGLFLNNELRTGGHRRYLELMEDLALRDNRVVVLLNEELKYEPEHFVAIRVKARYARGGAIPIALVFRAAAAGSVASVAAAIGRPDWVLIHGETHFLAASLIAQKLGAALAFGHRSNAVREQLMKIEELREGGGRSRIARFSAWWEMQKYLRYEKLVARRADLVIFQSAYDRDDFGGRAALRDGQSAVVNGNIGEPRFKAGQEGANLSVKLERIVFVGTFGPRKGVRYLVDAIKILAQRGLGNLRFELIGPGDDRERYERLLREWGLAEMAVLRGRVADPFPLLAGADLMVVPSLFDSFPDTVLEALHVGTPVIASRVGGIPEMLVHDELLFPPMDAAAIADRIQQCAEEPIFYARLRGLCAGRREAFHFDWAEAWERAMKDRRGTLSSAR